MKELNLDSVYLDREEIANKFSELGLETLDIKLSIPGTKKEVEAKIKFSEIQEIAEKTGLEDPIQLLVNKSLIELYRKIS